ncbi:hypothetical protein GCM10009830_24680 [Glycomyces endophyticus]|uniref:DUF1273 domain-containing protein n=2 Tax=Glycomyces endophyticus TaxID=480996 RepID=A0ABN2GUA2_9ACTN
MVETGEAIVRVGISGHMDVSESTARLVKSGIDRSLREVEGDLTGVTCLAFGADQIFAQSVLALGGTLEVILAAADYRERRVWAEHLPIFDGFLARARSVDVLPFAQAGPEAYVAANVRMLERIDLLLAVWDGGPAAVRGGTADAVAEAERRRLPVTVIWPDGARREG